MKCRNKNILLLLIIIIPVLVVIGAGIYKFNFTQQDIYTPQSGDVTQEDNTQKREDVKLEVVTSITPLASIVNFIGGESVNVNNLIPVGVSPHGFDLKPKQMMQIDSADVVIGLGFDDIDGFLTKKVKKSNIFTVTEGISLREAGEDHHHHGHEDEHDDEHSDEHDDEHDDDKEWNKDPHVWTSPSNAILIAEKIKTRLTELSPMHSELYEQNYKNFETELQKIVSDFQNNINGKELQSFIVFHDAYNYLLADLGIDESKKFVFQENVMNDPNAEELKELIEQIKLSSISVAFREPQFKNSNLEKFAKDYNLDVLVLDPHGQSNDRLGYLENIKNNLKSLQSVYE